MPSSCFQSFRVKLFKTEGPLTFQDPSAKDLIIVTAHSGQSDQFPGTSYGYIYNLSPKLQEQVKEAFLTFDWTGSGLAKDFGKRADCFIPVDYKKHWKVIRTIQKGNDVVYTQEALKKLKD